MVISITKITQCWDCLIFIMGIPILVRQHLYTETVPRLTEVWMKHLIWWYSWMNIMSILELFLFMAWLIARTSFEIVMIKIKPFLCTQVTFGASTFVTWRNWYKMLATHMNQLKWVVVSMNTLQSLFSTNIFLCILFCVTHQQFLN